MAEIHTALGAAFNSDKAMFHSYTPPFVENATKSG